MRPLREFPSRFWTELLTDLGMLLGPLTTLLFAGPELLHRDGWWPKPLYVGLMLFWAIVLWRRSADAQSMLKDAMRGGADR